MKYDYLVFLGYILKGKLHKSVYLNYVRSIIIK
jgi:hypothetical protein